MKRKDIIDAWAMIRETNHTIPDEVLDFMKNAAISQLLEEKETEETILAAAEERDTFAMGFLRYVEDTYTKKDDQYYFKHHNQHVSRNLNEVLGNYKYFLERVKKEENEKQGT